MGHGCSHCLDLRAMAPPLLLAPSPQLLGHLVRWLRLLRLPCYCSSWMELVASGKSQPQELRGGRH